MLLQTPIIKKLKTVIRTLKITVFYNIMPYALSGSGEVAATTFTAEESLLL
jgi:hypothetical protein